MALCSALILSGCSPTVPDAPKVPKAPKAEVAEAPPAEDAPASVAIGDRPGWAVNPVDIGAQVGEYQGGSWNVQIYRVGTAMTTTDGIWEMPVTSDPVIPADTAMAVYNVVFTNTSEEELLLDQAATAAGITLIHHGVEEFKAPLLSYDPEMTIPFGLSDLPYDPLELDTAPRFDDRPGLPVAPGESFAIAVNTWVVAGEISVDAFVNVMNERGKPLPEASELLSFSITQ